MGRVNIGIPSQETERIILLNRKQNTLCELENQERFISIPVLFKLEDNCSFHGLVLKSTKAKEKTILITPKIEIELDIPREIIFSLPKVLAGNYKYFLGACITDNKPIFILNTDKLTEQF